VEEGFFMSVSIPDDINEIGLFVQNGKVVGWSFGQWQTQGYMWKGGTAEELKYDTLVSSFYNITFAYGREEKFAMALAMQNNNAGLDKLAAFIEGFRMHPKLAPEDTPYYVLPEEIIKQIRAIVTNALNSGEGSKVVHTLNSQMLKNIGDLYLFMDVVPVIAAVRGYEAAINEIEDSGRYLVQQTELETAALDELHLQLYQEWVQSLISSGAIDEGWLAHNAASAHYPDDPYIHLLAVELELLGNNWQEAERLLNMRDYPPVFQDRYQVLANRILEMKGLEGKIVIRFPGGSSRIPVTASVNGTLYQDFLVDTGASLVTIPLLTVQELGLEIDPGDRGSRRIVTTASGVVIANEVMIDSLEIGEWIEYDIRALVLDLPNQRGVGLLGLNYLRRFQMDLKTDEGILLLTPQ
jgi:clan AA aspartic protease (TIGR02281 family)